MKHKVLIAVISIAVLVPLLGGIAFATNLVAISDWNLGESYLVNYGNGKNTNYSMDELIQMYKSSGVEYKRIEAAYQLNDLYLARLDSQFSAQDSIINQYRQSINQYEAQIDYYQSLMDSYPEDSDEWKEAKNHRDTCLSNLNTYQSYLTEAITQKAEIYVQRENYLFINNNKDILRIQDQKKTVSEFKEKCLYLIVLKENYNLASSSVDYNNLLYQINKANFNQGRSTRIDVDYQEAELLIANNNSESVLSSYNNLFKHILRMIEINKSQKTGIRFDIKSMRHLTLINYETAYNSFKQNDIKTKQMESNISVLNGKIDILNDVYEEHSNILAIESTKKEIAEVELEKWLIDRIISFNNLYSDYEAKYDAVNLQEKKAAAQHKKYTVTLNKFNLGMISRIELEEARLKLRQSELDAWLAFYEYAKAYNTIELAMMGSV